MIEYKAISKDDPITTAISRASSRSRASSKRSPDGHVHVENNIKYSWTEVLLRALGLSIVWNGWRKLLHRPKTEAPKQAMRYGRLVVFLTMSTHFIPMIAAGMIMGLNFRGYYIGSELSGPDVDNNLKLSGLQFTAKLHELLMQASLSLVVVSFIRHELIRGQGIPFGAIFGSVQFSSPTYLWSKEFVGTLKAQFRSKLTKWGLAFLILVGSVLFSLVGPSTAIAMRPQLGDWPAGGTYFYLNATKDQLWPSNLDASNTLPPFTRPWGVIADSLLPFWPGLDDSTMFPDTYNVPSNKSMKTLYTRQRIGLSAASWTIATTQMSNLADAMTEIGALWINAAFVALSVPGRRYSSQFRFRKDVFWSVKDIYRPLTRVQCWSAQKPTLKDIDAVSLYVPNIETFCPDGQNSGESFNDTSQFTTVLANYNDSSSISPVLEFVKLPTDVFGENTIGAIISFPPSWPGGNSFVTCAVDARCKEPALIKGSRNAVKIVAGHSDIDDGYADRGVCGKTFTGPVQTDIRRIKVTKDWANQLNPRVESSNRTAIHEILGSIPTAQNYRWNDTVEFVSPLIESVLSVLITNGLASTAYNAVPQGSLKGCTESDCSGTCEDGNGEWCKAIMPINSEFGYGGEIYNLPPSADLSSMTRFRVHIDINGYAYYWRDTTVILSCVVLGIYCLIALSHIIFALITGLSSQSWDTISEIVALAMQSQPSEQLRGTSAGIVTTSIFQNFVKVGKTGEAGEHLELIFEDPEMDGGSVVPVVVDEFYE